MTQFDKFDISMSVESNRKIFRRKVSAVLFEDQEKYKIF